MRSRSLSTFLLCACAGSALADGTASSAAGSDAADLLMKARIEGMKALPITGLQMVKAGGKVFFMSNNGRFVITGTLMDVWNRVAVTDLDQVDQIASRIDLAKMKLKIDDLGPITYGTGREQVVVFVDPRCPYCAKVQKQMEGLQDRYTFKLVSVPVLGPESQSLVTRIGCLLQTKDKDKARNALMHQTYDALPANVDPACNREPVQRALVTAHLFGIEAVPFLIAPDGRTFKGAPDSLADWLADKPAPQVSQQQLKEPTVQSIHGQPPSTTEGAKP
jgi:thiol:disulfide interchange protein DsbC